MSVQNISYYQQNDENYADVYVNEDLIFTCRVGGLENTNKTVILLHGFPETSRMWKGLIETLSSSNYRVIAPDQRGYSKGARPLKVDDYKASKLSQDIINIANAFSVDKFHLIGHDWGSAIGWALTSKFKNRVLTFTALSVPHLDAFSYAIINDETQKKKSYYIKLFRLKFLPELYFKIFNYKNLRNLWSSSDENEIESYLNVFSQTNALKCALNWYRAINLSNTKKIGNIFVSTLMIYGTKDIAIGEKAVDETEKYMKGPYSLIKIKASHWLVQDSFDLVSKKILNHLRS